MKKLILIIGFFLALTISKAQTAFFTSINDTTYLYFPGIQVSLSEDSLRSCGSFEDAVLKRMLVDSTGTYFFAQNDTSQFEQTFFIFRFALMWSVLKKSGVTAPKNVEWYHKPYWDYQTKELIWADYWTRE